MSLFDESMRTRVGDLPIQFPVKNPVLIREVVGYDICPCSGILDRGKVCMSCGTDWSKYVPARYRWERSSE